MNIQEFLEVSGEIEKFYCKSDGKPNELTKFERETWFEELKRLSKERFRQLARECFKNNKFMPKLCDILTYNRTVPMPQNNIEIQEENCDICKSRGFVTYKQKIDGFEYEYMARCICSNSLKYAKYPSIKELNLFYEEVK